MDVAMPALETTVASAAHSQRVTKKKKKKKTSRSAGRPSTKTSENIVRSILLATLAQLKERGYAQLNLKEVAKSAGVAKTSLYRRWPTKWKLVSAAWVLWREDHTPVFQPSDDFRADLADLLLARAGRPQSLEGRVIAQGLISVDDEETVALADVLYTTNLAPVRALLARGAAERRLRVKAREIAVASELLLGLVSQRVMWRKKSLSRRDAEDAIAIVLRGLGVSAP